MPTAVGHSHVERQRAFMQRLDDQAKRCYLRCIRQGMTAPEARITALDDINIRKRASNGKAIKFQTP